MHVRSTNISGVLPVQFWQLKCHWKAFHEVINNNYQIIDFQRSSTEMEKRPSSTMAEDIKLGTLVYTWYLKKKLIMFLAICKKI